MKREKERKAKQTENAKVLATCMVLAFQMATIQERELPGLKTRLQKLNEEIQKLRDDVEAVSTYTSCGAHSGAVTVVSDRVLLLIALSF